MYFRPQRLLSSWVIMLCSSLLIGCAGGNPPQRPASTLVLDPGADVQIVKYVDSVMDDTDRLVLVDLFSNPANGMSREWANNITGYSFLVVVAHEWTTSRGACYEFVLDARQAKEIEHDIYGTACRLSDKLWLVS